MAACPFACLDYSSGSTIISQCLSLLQKRRPKSWGWMNFGGWTPTSVLEPQPLHLMVNRYWNHFSLTSHLIADWNPALVSITTILSLEVSWQWINYGLVTRAKGIMVTSTWRFRPLIGTVVKGREAVHNARENASLHGREVTWPHFISLAPKCAQHWLVIRKAP